MNSVDTETKATWRQIFFNLENGLLYRIGSQVNVACGSKYIKGAVAWENRKKEPAAPCWSELLADYRRNGSTYLQASSPYTMRLVWKRREGSSGNRSGLHRYPGSYSETMLPCWRWSLRGQLNEPGWQRRSPVLIWDCLSASNGLSPSAMEFSILATRTKLHLMGIPLGPSPAPPILQPVLRSSRNTKRIEWRQWFGMEIRLLCVYAATLLPHCLVL